MPVCHDATPQCKVGIDSGIVMCATFVAQGSFGMVFGTRLVFNCRLLVSGDGAGHFVHHVRPVRFWYATACAYLLADWTNASVHHEGSAIARRCGIEQLGRCGVPMLATLEFNKLNLRRMIQVFLSFDRHY
jgi:hypothetical protein